MTSRQPARNDRIAPAYPLPFQGNRGEPRVELRGAVGSERRDTDLAEVATSVPKEQRAARVAAVDGRPRPRALSCRCSCGRCTSVESRTHPCRRTHRRALSDRKPEGWPPSPRRPAGHSYSPTRRSRLGLERAARLRPIGSREWPVGRRARRPRCRDGCRSEDRRSSGHDGPTKRSVARSASPGCQRRPRQRVRPPGRGPHNELRSGRCRARSACRRSGGCRACWRGAATP